MRNGVFHFHFADPVLTHTRHAIGPIGDEIIISSEACTVLV